MEFMALYKIKALEWVGDVLAGETRSYAARYRYMVVEGVYVLTCMRFDGTFDKVGGDHLDLALLKRVADEHYDDLVKKEFAGLLEEAG